MFGVTARERLSARDEESQHKKVERSMTVQRVSLTGGSRNAGQKRVKGTALRQGAWSSRGTSWSVFSTYPFLSWETWAKTAGKYMFGVHVS